MENTRVMAVLGLVLGCVSLVVLAPLFGPAAIVCGTIAGAKGSTMGWCGAVIGLVGLIIWALLILSAT